MKGKFCIILLLVALVASFAACSNGAKEKYQAQKEYVDSLQKADKQYINDEYLNSITPLAVVVAQMKCYHKEVEALDSLRILAKDAFGDNSAEYQEAYDEYVKVKDLYEQASNAGLKELRDVKNAVR